MVSEDKKSGGDRKECIQWFFIVKLFIFYTLSLTNLLKPGNCLSSPHTILDYQLLNRETMHRLGLDKSISFIHHWLTDSNLVCNHQPIDSWALFSVDRTELFRVIFF